MADLALSDSDAAELDALERLIRRADGFALAFARVNNAARQIELATELKARLDGEVRVLDVRVPPETTDLQALLREAHSQEDGEPAGALFVTGIGRVLSAAWERKDFLPVLNFKRENLQRSVPVPVVLWVPEYALRHIARGAPDLWAWRSGVFEFASSIEEVREAWELLAPRGSKDEYSKMSPASRQDRIQKLEALYDDYARLDSKLASEGTMARASIAGRLGRLYKQTADLNSAVEWAEKAVELHEEVFGLDHIRTIASVENLGSVLCLLGEYEEAEKRYRWAIDRAENILGPSHSQVFGIADSIGTVLRHKGDFKGAYLMYRKAIAGLEGALGAHHPDTLRSLGNLGSLLHHQGDLGSAEPLYLETLEGRMSSLGPDHPDTVLSVNNLATLLRSQGKLDEAESLYRQALEANRRLLGSRHPNTLMTIDNLGGVLYSKGDLDASERHCREALKGFELVLGLDHPTTIRGLSNLGFVLRAQGKLSDAECCFTRAIDASRKSVGSEHPSTLQYQSNLEGLRSERK